MSESASINEPIVYDNRSENNRSPVNEDIVVIESKDYAQIIFDEVKDCYGEQQALECSFTLSELIKPESSDSIGIFKVGFNSCDEFVCNSPVDAGAIQENKGRVRFEGDVLPKDDGEFYQFVYVSQSKFIRGASIPFQFKKANQAAATATATSSDYVEISSQDDAVFVNSKENPFLNDALVDIKSRCLQLTKENDNYERILLDNEDLIKSLKDEVSTFKIRCLRLTMDNEKLNFALSTKSDDLKELADKIVLLTNENVKLESSFADLKAENKNLAESLQNRIDQVSQLKSDLNCLKMTENSNEDLSQELNMSRDKLLAAEQCKEMLHAQLVVLSTELNEAQAVIDKHLQQIKHLMENEKRIEAEKEALSATLDSVKRSYERKLDEVNGAYFALRLANSHLEQRLKSSELRCEKVEQELSAQQQEMRRVTLENEELRERIQAGCKEYSKLSEKYRLLKNKQFNYDMNVYHDLSGDIHLRKDLAASEANRYQQLRQLYASYSRPSDEQSTDSAIQDASRSQTAADNTLDALMNSTVYNADRWNSLQGKQQQDAQTSKQTEQPAIHIETTNNTMIIDLASNAGNHVEAAVGSDSISQYDRIDLDTGLCEEETAAVTPKQQSNAEANKNAEQQNSGKLVNLTCEVCQFMFPTDTQVQELERHYSAHYGPSCPVCFKVFSKDYPQEQFESHVNTHFAN